MLPNFIIIGAHKAGTSSLHEYLKHHPHVFMPTRLKEPRFFAFDETNPALTAKSHDVFPVRTMESYRSLFSSVKDEIAIGEASPEYLNSSIAAHKIHNTIPHAKIVVSLRNPVDRAYSQYLMEHRNGRVGGSFKEAFYKRLNKNSYSRQSVLYYDNLKRYVDLFGINHVKVILFDDLKSNSSHVIKDLYQFLHVDDSFSPDLSHKHNKGGVPKNRLMHKVLSNRHIRRRLKPLFPSSLRKIGRKIKDMNLESAPKLTPDVREELLDVFRDDVLRLQDLIKRDLSIWLHSHR